MIRKMLEVAPCPQGATPGPVAREPQYGYQRIALEANRIKSSYRSPLRDGEHISTPRRSRRRGAFVLHP